MKEAFITWKTSGNTIFGEPGDYYIKVVRSDLGKIYYCIVYHGVNATTGVQSEIGTAHSIIKAKKLAERHASANREMT